MILKRFIIIGSGPAGYTAAIYAARSGFEPILFTGSIPGGQLIQTTQVENFPGFPEGVLGYTLMERMQQQAKFFGTQIILESICNIHTDCYPFQCDSESGKKYQADAIIFATGATAKWLNIPGEEIFKGYGVSGCATCDGFFYRNQTVVVIGGGNTAVSDALFLANQAKQVILIHRRDSLRTEKILQERLFATQNIQVRWNMTVTEICGELEPRKVTHIKLLNLLTQEEEILHTDGVFVAIGHEPQTELLRGKVDLTSSGYIKLNPGSTETSIPGIFAAGDVADERYQQAITAAGYGCMAAMDAERFLLRK